jgi:signal transduction histidine kinase
MKGRKKHGIIATITLVLGLIFLYSGYFPWSESAHVYRDFSKGPIHYEISLLLLTVAIIYVSLIFRTRIGIATALLVTLAVLPHQIFGLHEIPFFRPISFGVATVLIAMLVGTILNLRDQASEAHDIEQSLARQVVITQERERQVVAHELHDVVLQEAVDITHGIDELLETVSGEENKTRLRKLRTDLENMMEETRQLVRGLRPPVLDDIGLVLSLRELADSRTEDTVEITVNVVGKERRLPDIVETALFRIAEESLNNTKRHSKATRIKMVIEFTAEKILLEISDNGIGFTVPSDRQLVNQNKFGIVDIAERARLAGGNMRIKSAKDKGTVISVDIPV